MFCSINMFSFISIHFNAETELIMKAFVCVLCEKGINAFIFFIEIDMIEAKRKLKLL